MSEKMTEVIVENIRLAEAHRRLLRQVQDGAEVVIHQVRGPYLCQSGMCDPTDRAVVQDLRLLGALDGITLLRITEKGRGILKIFTVAEAARSARCA